MSTQNEVDGSGEIVESILSRPELLLELEHTIAEVGTQLLDAGKADMAAFAPRLTAQLLFAQSTGSEVMVASVKRQIRLIGEAQRIRATDAGWEIFLNVVTLASRVMVAAAASFASAAPAVAAAAAAVAEVARGGALDTGERFPQTDPIHRPKPARKPLDGLT